MSKCKWWGFTKDRLDGSNFNFIDLEKPDTRITTELSKAKLCTCASNNTVKRQSLNTHVHATLTCSQTHTPQ